MHLRILDYFLLITFILIITSCTSSKNNPFDLKVSEGFVNPFGFYDSIPSFSWKIPNSESIKSQSAYKIVVASSSKLLPDNADIWDSDIVQSDQSIFIKYGGKPFSSREKVYWQVKYWDQNGNPSEWSDIANFEIGLLNNSDWQSKWIGKSKDINIDTTEFGTAIFKPQYIRKDFQFKSKIKKARIYTSAKGVFELQINGEKIGEDIMPPGWTPYKKRIEVITYDITQNLINGENTIGFILAPGWYSGRLGYKKDFWVEKEPPKVICQIEVLFSNGDSKIHTSDSTWKVTDNGSIRFSEIYDGEIYDANYDLGNWSKTNYDDKLWDFVETQNVENDIRLQPKRHNTVKNKIELETMNITKIDSGKIIFDLGQNMVGVPRLNVPMNNNSKLKIRFAEMLNKDGSLYTENYRSALSTNYYYSNEEGKIDWQPKFTFHGFRYVEISGFDSDFEPEKSWVKGIAQYSDFDQTGSFNSSNTLLNQLQSNIVWGLRGNFLDIPTDCPQRDERLGWTGDAQVFAPTSFFNADVHSFWSSWLQSMREEQLPDGGIPVIIPNLTEQRVSSGWGDAAVIIPWETYKVTGDKSVLEENYEMMKKWIEFYDSKVKNNIVNTSLFGDWLQPFTQSNRRGDTPFDLISTAYYAYSVKLVMQTAATLNEKNEESLFRSKFEVISNSFQDYFFDNNGEIKDNKGTQTGYLLAIGFGLLDEEMEKKAIPSLIDKIAEADNHLRTGFLGTPLLAKVLDKIGRSDLMYEILFKETYPSWFYSINQGATTMWERWNSYSHKDGFGNAGMNSFNHYAYGAIGEWMYERIAGINLMEPGYKKILIAPIIGTKLSFAEGNYKSPYGEIISAWKKTDTRLIHFVKIPTNTTAKIVLPINNEQSILINDKDVKNQSDISNHNRTSEYISFEVSSGEYSIVIFDKI